MTKFDSFSTEQQELAKVAKLFSNPARIAIVQILAEKKEIRTGNISDFLPLNRTTVSQHLQELNEMGVIKGTIDGKMIHYCLNMEKLNEMKNAFDKFFDSSISSFLCIC